MRKVLIGFVLIVFAMLLGSIVFEVFQPRPFVWYPSYESYDKQPYGGSIFVDQLKYFFPGKKVDRMGRKDLDAYYPYELEEDAVEQFEKFNYDSTLELYDYGETIRKTFNFIALSPQFKLNNRDTEALLNHIYQGNHGLIAAQSVGGMLKYHTGIEFEKFEFADSSLNIDQHMISFEGRDFEQVAPLNSFSSIVSFPDSAEVIAKNKNDDVVGVKLKVGKGSLTYFSVPIVFSNYHILNDSSHVAEQLLKTLPLEDTRWTNYYVGGTFNRYKNKRSLLDFIHKQEALSWAFYTLLVSILLFFVFRIKREQRAVPVVSPPENVSLKFTETISNLYLLHRDNKELISKKMSFFLEELRTTHNIDTNKVDTRFYKRVAAKYNVRETLPKHIFQLYDDMMNKAEVSDEEFLRFNKLIQTFKQNKNG